MAGGTAIREMKSHRKKGSLAHPPARQRETAHLIRTCHGQLQATLSQVAQQIVQERMQSCSAEAAKQGESQEKIEELAEVLKYLRNY